MTRQDILDEFTTVSQYNNEPQMRVVNIPAMADELSRLRKELQPFRDAKRRGNVMIEVNMELLARDVFSDEPLHLMLLENVDGTHTLVCRRSDTLHKLQVENADLRAAIDRVLRQHHRGAKGMQGTCMACGYNYPCPTLRTLDGEDA